MTKRLGLTIGLNEVDPNHYRDADGNPWRGTLAACENDARSMAQLFSAHDVDLIVDPLLTAAATCEEVLKQLGALAAAAGPGDLVAISYSGHGGQIEDLDGDEDDGLDETWCLFDRQLIDDELARAYSKFQAGVQIVVFSDSCHSGTVARADAKSSSSLPKAKAMADLASVRTMLANKSVYDAVAKSLVDDTPVSLAATVVLLSGCRDEELSRDGDPNGAFTGAILTAWEQPAARKSFRALVEAAGKLIPPAYEQHPTYSVYTFGEVSSFGS